MSDPSNTSLAHFAWNCPGMHGKDSRQEIRRMTFRQLFSIDKTLVIPIIQRRYCWHGDTVWRWFEDVVRGSRDHLGVHNTGNVVLKTGDSGDSFIVIDGQQRITTTMLFLIALRNEVSKLNQTFNNVSQECDKLLGQINSCLYVGKHQRLVPSFYDREPFSRLLNNQGDTDEEPLTNNTSFQTLSKLHFSHRIQEEVKAKKLSTADHLLEFYQELLHLQLDLMGLTYVEIHNDINLPQV